MNKLYLKAQLQKAADGSIEFVASDETVDRSGESIPASSWDLTNYLKSPRLLVDHDYRVESIVGIADKTRVEGKELRFVPKFHEITELAKTVAKMVIEGVLDTVSVGFMRNQDEKGNVKNELMEISFVAVPANPNARMLAVKSIDADETKAIEAFLKSDDGDQSTKPEPVEGDTCTMEDGTEGVMTMTDDGMVCMLKPTEEKAPKEGDPCKMPDETDGEMHMDESGNMVCMLKAEPADEKKGMTEDTIAAHDEMMKIKRKYMDQVWMKYCHFCDAYCSDSLKIEDIKTLMAELATAITEVAAMTPDQLQGDMMWCGFDAAIKSMQRFSIKTGRVLSEKNRDTIKAQIDSLESVIAALKELHDATQPQGSEDEKAKATSKKERSIPATPTLDAVKLYEGLIKHNEAMKVLRIINVATSDALREIKQRRQK